MKNRNLLDKPTRMRVDREMLRQRLDLLSDTQLFERAEYAAPFRGCTPSDENLIVFTVYLKRVGADAREYPSSTIIPAADEQKNRDIYHTIDWFNWADRNRIYRNVRIEVKPYKGE